MLPSITVIHATTIAVTVRKTHTHTQIRHRKMFGDMTKRQTDRQTQRHTSTQRFKAEGTSTRREMILETDKK